MNKNLTKTDYQCNVTAYIAMFIRDVFAADDSGNDDLMCYDIVFEIAEGLADDFIDGEYDDANSPLYTCVEEFMYSDNVQKKLKNYK